MAIIKYWFKIILSAFADYTDIQQSMILTKILSLESADYCWGIDDETSQYNNSPYPCAWKDYSCKEYYIPCWSLAELLGVLPESIADDKNKLIAYMNIYKYDSLWVCAYDYENQEDGNYISFSKESLVDACYEMILRLHERRIL